MMEGWFKLSRIGINTAVVLVFHTVFAIMGMQLFSDGYDLKRPKSVDSNLASWSKSALTM